MIGSPPRRSAEAIVDTLEPGMTVFLAGMTGESLVLRDALRARPEKAADVRFVGVFFPGINDGAYVGLHPRARQRAYFMSPAFRPGFQDERVELLPTDYLGAWRDLSSLEIDLAVVQASEPDPAGRSSLGICHDFAPAAWSRAKRRVAHINPAMPRTHGAAHVRLDECDAVIEAPADLLTYPAEPASASYASLAGHIAGLVRDGDTIQLGIGRMVTGVLDALRGHRGLRLHAGMATQAVVPLIDGRVIEGRAAVTLGVALGDRDYYRRAALDDTFLFAPVDETHDPRRIAAIDNFVAINAALEVDLFGQVNCDTLGRQLVAGVGGMPAFAAGARLSRGGRAVFALLSTAAAGARSRIVSRLSGGALVGAPRHVADLIVTEHGVADLRGASIPQRAQRLMAIAAPQHRALLEAQWKTLCASL
ncbi:Acyl coenzyme A hydrolase/transferase [Castellaniella defragrans 65Phen]|jgi:acyl-CoA hydrolase|uniref:Acyl coenzyme A hydrolase/transferase n=2 Tax=Castellaniella defragrans TaxID=75697 RepID=W8X9R8_CASD6|nr:acetyl-CoA hydrolase/transferase C-terminal domain-containing protein [Castellaniella defragrans]KAB0622752.1 acetyl-CoA hydrolase [Castellaniella defragrans]MBB6085230.1 acyl-CoA hydrolase [Castellaniella defragrans]CDM25300.1 Acyl coenzyme A hydrolase/transferase [Castellaniella defragrans 65Phen]